MKDFNYHQPTDIRFGGGRVKEVGDIVAHYGKRCLLVTVPPCDRLTPLFDKIKTYLKTAGIEVAHFDGVIPNPTSESITAGAEMALSHNADVVLGVGGGSSMDSAKTIAVEATHEGKAWDYRWCSETQPTDSTLPVIVVSTTSGTGSQVTQVGVLTKTEDRDKTAIYNPHVFPRVCIVDPELMVTVPEHVTASTGFDAFAHALESYIHSNASPYTDILAQEAIRLIVKHLPVAVKNGANIGARNGMAWADTLAGLCIANAGVTVPHGIGMQISGLFPHIMHGEAMAATYPAFTRFTCRSAITQFSTVGRILNSELLGESDETAAEKACDAIDTFLEEIGMRVSLEELQVPEEQLEELTERSIVLPDYKANPRVPTQEELFELLRQSFKK